MTEWQNDAVTVVQETNVPFSVPSRGWHRAMCTSVGGNLGYPLLLEYPRPLSLHCSMQCAEWAAISASKRQHHHYAAVSHIWHEHPQLEQLRPRGTPFVSFPSGGSDWTAKWHSATGNYQPNHIQPGFLLMMMTAQGVAAVPCRLSSPRPTWHFQRFSMAISTPTYVTPSVLPSLSLLAPLLPCLYCVAWESRSGWHVFVSVSDGRVHSWSAKYMYTILSYIMENVECV